MFRFTIRDVLWLTVVVACLAAWWIDQERIRGREAAQRVAEQAFADELEKLRQRLQSFPLREAEAKLKMAEFELEILAELNQKHPAVASESELRRLELGLEIAKLDVEKARAKDEFGPITNLPPKGRKSN